VNVTLTISEIGSRGDGVAEADGRRYFVPFTLPGETVIAEPRAKRGEAITADLVEVLAPSRHREKPPCAHFGVCGGCALQHWRHDAYTTWKVAQVERALRQRGVAAPVFEPPVLGVPAERRHIDLVMRRQGRQVLAGFHERASPRVVDIGACVVVLPALNALLPPLRATLADVLPDSAAANAIVNETGNGLDVLIRPHRRLDLTLERREALVGLARNADLARLSWGDRSNAEPVVTYRPPVLRFGEAVVEVPPGAFLQATVRAEQAMRSAISAWLEDSSEMADLFAGIGSLSLGRSGRLTLFESDQWAVAAVDTAARRWGTNRVKVRRRDLFRNPLTIGELDAFECVVLDPPRAGAAAQVAEIARTHMARVVYASCDPGSFARDARELQDGGFRLVKLLPIDQFLWSVHVELIALFIK